MMSVRDVQLADVDVVRSVPSAGLYHSSIRQKIDDDDDVLRVVVVISGAAETDVLQGRSLSEN